MESQSNPSPRPEQLAGEKGSDVIVLPGTLTINEAAEWRTDLLEKLGRGSLVVVDCEAVSAVDTIGLQLLCSARRTALSAGGQFVLRGRSAVLRRACDAAGLPAAEIGLATEEVLR